MRVFCTRFLHIFSCSDLKSGAAALVAKIRGIPSLLKCTRHEVVQKFSQPTTWTTLPFPAIALPTKPIRFGALASEFHYMGRARFKGVYEATVGLFGSDKNALLVYGTKGYGKSHIIAAVALALLLEERRVVYIADAVHIVRHATALRDAAAVAFHDCPYVLEKLARLNGLKATTEYLAQLKNIVLIVDQMNGVEAPGSQLDGDDKKAVRDAIRDINPVAHVFGYSANNDFVRGLLKDDQRSGRAYLPLYGGFSKVSDS